MSRWTFLLFTCISIFCCKKQEIDELENKETIQNIVGQELNKSKDGIERLLKIQDLNTEIKKSLNLNLYKYYSNSPSSALWIIALKNNSLGFKQSKIMATIHEGKFNLKILSYDYDEKSYRHGDSSTFGGTITIFDNNLKEVKTLHYAKGKIIKIRIPGVSEQTSSSCPTCPPSPDTPHNWCTEINGMCEYLRYEGRIVMFAPMDADGPSGVGGGGGCDNCHPAVVNNIIYLLSIDNTQIGWLSINLDRAYEIYNYLQSSTHMDAKFIAKDHLEGMMRDNVYLNFVEGHEVTGDKNKMWWEDDAWISNPNNFNLDINAINNQYDELTNQEKQLCLSFPVQAHTIRQNIAVAVAMTNARMGIGTNNGLNDRADAFRHAFFNTINTRDCFPAVTPVYVAASKIVRRFGQAHEENVPPILNLEKEMDLFNNDVGIDYCWNCFTTSNNSIADALRTKLTNGELLYLNPLNINTHPFYDAFPRDRIQDCPTCTNGITGTTKLTPTIQ